MVSINDKGIFNENVPEQSAQSFIWQISDLQRDLASAASCLRLLYKAERHSRATSHFTLG